MDCTIIIIKTGTRGVSMKVRSSIMRAFAASKSRRRVGGPGLQGFAGRVPSGGPGSNVVSSKARIGGMTLVELLVAVAISGLAFAALASQMSFSARSFAALANYVDLDIHNRNALDKMSTEIRQANRVISCSASNLQFETVEPGTGTTNTLTYTYDAAAATLNRVYAGQTNTLLKQVSPNSLQFLMFQRNPVGGSVDQYSTTNTTLCKVVQMSWTCSRNILGQQANTESAQCAKVMIRKE